MNKKEIACAVRALKKDDDYIPTKEEMRCMNLFADRCGITAKDIAEQAKIYLNKEVK